VAARGVVETSVVMKNGSGKTYRIWGQRMLAQQAALGVARPVLQPGSPFYLETAGSFALAFPLAQIEATAKRWGGDLYPSEASLRARWEDARSYADMALAFAENAIVIAPGPATPPASGGEPVQVQKSVPRITTTPGCVAWSGAAPGNVRLGVGRSGLRV